MWTAVTAANSHHQWHCGFFHPERSCIQGLAWVEFVWCATASNQFRFMTATQATPWVCWGSFRVPYGPSTSRETEELPKYRTVLSVSSPLGHTITIPSGFLTLIPPYPFFPSSFSSSLFPLPIHFFLHLPFYNDFISPNLFFFLFSIFLLSNICKEYEGIHLQPFQLYTVPLTFSCE